VIPIVKLTSKKSGVTKFINMNHVVYWNEEDGGSMLEFSPMAWFQIKKNSEEDDTSWMVVKETPEQIEKLLYEAQVAPMIDKILGASDAN
jgi:hypothetical protein